MNITDAITYFGSRSKLAKALKVGKSAISNWGGEIPENRQYQIQVITKGKLVADQGKAA